MTYRFMEIAAVVLAAIGGACSTSAEQDVSAGSTAAAPEPNAASAERTGLDRNACDLLTVAEVSAAVGSPVTARETNRERGRSDCWWSTADSVVALGLVGYWTGGAEGWDIMAASRGMAKDILQNEEGVVLDSIVKAGPVAGVGDKALFSPLLPSLVLEGNVLLEFTLSPLDNPAAHFRSLATKALSRL
jgi:hypothetical protein